MRFMTKVKFGLISFMALAVVLVASGTGREWLNRDKDREDVLVRVVFEPSPRDKKVTMVIAVNGKAIPSYATLFSPWPHPMVVQRGSFVSALITQDEAGSLTCTITRNGVETLPQSRTTKGSIRCSS